MNMNIMVSGEMTAKIYYAIFTNSKVQVSIT